MSVDVETPSFRLTPRIVSAALVAPLILPLLHLFWNVATRAPAYAGSWGREKLFGVIVWELVATYAIATAGLGLVTLALRLFRWPVSSRVLVPVSTVVGAVLCLLFIVPTALFGPSTDFLELLGATTVFVCLSGIAAAIVSATFCLAAGVPWRRA